MQTKKRKHKYFIRQRLWWVTFLVACACMTIEVATEDNKTSIVLETTIFVLKVTATDIKAVVVSRIMDIRSLPSRGFVTIV